MKNELKLLVDGRRDAFLNDLGCLAVVFRRILKFGGKELQDSSLIVNEVMKGAHNFKLELWTIPNMIKVFEIHHYCC